jgi:steroid delta-isomerase-like uncharacterized protein
MSVDETKHVISEYLDALRSGGDFGASFADDVRWTTMETGEVISGRDAVRDFIVAMHAKQFEAAPELEGVVYGDGAVALEATFVGKHVAEFAGVEPTGAVVRVPYSMFYEIEGGRITALRAYLPIAALVEQLKAHDPSLTG